MIYTTFYLQSAQDVSIDILDAIKANFKSKPITITVAEDLDARANIGSIPANESMPNISLEQEKKDELVELKTEDKSQKLKTDIAKKLNPSDYRGCISSETADKLNVYIEKTRNEWNKSI